MAEFVGDINTELIAEILFIIDLEHFFEDNLCGVELGTVNGYAYQFYRMNEHNDTNVIRF